MGIAQYKNAIEQQRHHTLALSNEVCDFVLAQGSQKLSAKEEI